MVDCTKDELQLPTVVRFKDTHNIHDYYYCTTSEIRMYLNVLYMQPNGDNSIANIQNNV